MATTKSRRTSHFICNECGTVAPKWTGRCDGCGEWNTVVEEIILPGSTPSIQPASPALPITEVSTLDATPIATGIDELDRVLGGGLVAGSVTLVGGEPGIGKSTLLLQVLAHPSRLDSIALYVTAEESAQQVRRRAERLGEIHPNLLLAAETNLSHILSHIHQHRPTCVVVDSIQTVFDPELSSAPGSVGQVRHCSHQLVSVAKQLGVAVVLVGHVTKDGSLAGPRVLEHVVDTVLSFEGDRHHSLRLLRATKHRYGSTQEIGIFAMSELGLEPVLDPSAMFLADRRPGIAGSVVVATTDGNRPIMVEVQALVADSKASNPRRNFTGVDPGRVSLLLAVLERRAEIPVLALDAYAMAVGGARVMEPGADLGICAAVVSSLTGKPVPEDFVLCGEVGLGGELRGVSGLERRLSEAARLGFQRALVASSAPEMSVGLDLIRVSTVFDAMLALGLIQF